MQRIIPAILRFFKNLPQALFEAAKDGVTMFGRGFRRLGSVVRNVIDDAWQFLRRLPGRIWELAKDVASRFAAGFRRIGRFIRSTVDDAWQYLKRLPGRMWELAKDVVSFFWRGYWRIGRLIRKGIDDAWDWLKGFPKRLGDLAVDAVKAFGNAFKNLGKTMIEGIKSGTSAAGNLARTIVNGIFQLINDGWNKLIGGKEFGVGALKIKIPKLNLKLAEGGPVPGSGSGDTVAALLEPGEHVLTKKEVAALGGHRAVFALRRALGGGGQGVGGRYAEGGKTEGAAAGSLTITFKGGDLDSFGSQWRKFWQDLVSSARRNSNNIETQFRDMRAATARSADRMYRQIRGSIDDIENSFERRGKRISKNWVETWDSVKKVAYDGLKYVTDQTNKTLKGLDEKVINFGLSPPQKASDKKASGGWIGGKGQRGRDHGFYALGAGEAVLNWQHQRYVEPALNAFYGHGLTELFGRTRGYHAGGRENATGFAAGKLPDVMGSKPGFAAFMAYFKRNFGQDVRVISGSRPGSIIAGSGGLSNHSAGNAIDISNNASISGLPSNPPPKNKMDDLHAFIDKQLPKPPRLDFLWRTTTGGNHFNHIHLGIDAAITSTVEAARRWISKNFPDAASYDTGDAVLKRTVTGPDGALKTILQTIFNKTRKIANALIEKKIEEQYADTTGPGDSDETKVGPVGPGAENVFKFFRRQGFSDAQAAAWVGNFQQESGLNPAIIQPGGEGHGLAQWGHGRFTALQNFAKSHDKPWTDMGVQLAFVMHELRGSESAAYGPIKNAKTIEEATNAIGSKYERYGIKGDRSGPARQAFNKFAGKFAEGGIVPGPEGAPVPILAHAQEWILNKGQVGRLANMLGMNTDALRSMMGFYGGGAAGYQGGGTPGGDPEAGAPGEGKLNERYTTEYAKRRLAQLRKGLYELPILPLSTWESTLREAKRAFLAIKRRGQALSIQVGEINKQIKELEEGKESKEELKKIKKLKADRKALIESGTMVEEVAKVNKEIEKLQKGDEDKKQLREIAKLRQERRKLQRQGRAEVAASARLKALDALVREGGIIEQMDQARERFTATLARRLTFATYSFDKATKSASRRMDEVEIATRELQNARKELTKTLGEEGFITKALKTVNNRLRSLRRGGVTEEEAPELRELVTMQARLKEQRINIRETHAQALQRIYEAQVARQEAVINEINSRAERETGVQDIRRRMAEAIGDEGTIGQVQQAQRDILTKQANELQNQIANASKMGNTELVNSLTAQVADLRTTIFESIHQELRDAAERINTRAQRRLSFIDISGRFTDLLERAGNRQGAAGERVGQARDRGAVMGQQLAELQGLRYQAALHGNTALMEDLDLQIAELDATIAENTQTTQDLIVANHTLTAEIIKGTSERTTGLLGVGQSIIEKLGAGIIDPVKTLPFLRAIGTAIQTEATSLVNAISAVINDPNNPFGAFADQAEPILAAAAAAFQQGPEAFANWLLANAPAIAQLTEAMGGAGSPMGQLFGGLIDGLGSNTMAMLDNTTAVNEVTGTMLDPQTFASSAWTRFREAVFTGMGQVLPQYDQNNTMGEVNTGAVIIPAASTSSRVSGDTNIILNESGRPPDLQEISSVVTFASKTTQ